ncbi:MAG: hypothetical protein QXY49_01730 [Thermofilaceae archaeon]
MEKAILFIVFMVSMVCITISSINALSLRLDDKCIDIRRLSRDLLYISINRGTITDVYDLPKIDILKGDTILLYSEECGLSIKVYQACKDTGVNTLPKGRVRLRIFYSNEKNCVEIMPVEQSKN